MKWVKDGLEHSYNKRSFGIIASISSFFYELTHSSLDAGINSAKDLSASNSFKTETNVREALLALRSLKKEDTFDPAVHREKVCKLLGLMEGLFTYHYHLILAKNDLTNQYVELLNIVKKRIDKEPQHWKFYPLKSRFKEIIKRHSVRNDLMKSNLQKITDKINQF